MDVAILKIRKSPKVIWWGYRWGIEHCGVWVRKRDAILFLFQRAEKENITLPTIIPIESR